MDVEDLPYLGIHDLAQLIRDKQVSPKSLADAVLARIEKFDPLLHGYITVEPDKVMRQATEAETEIVRGDYRGPLHGIPIAHKDVIWTKDLRTTGHSKLLADFAAPVDATVVQRLNRAGAITIGKANTYEFACGGMDIFGAARNAWDLNRVAGGSSSGPAVVVASHLAIAATGTDTGGSIRVPASFCGVVGLKPTYGRVSRFGVMPLSWHLDHVGPITKSVYDAALMLRLMAGRDSRDQTSSRRPVPDYTANLDADLRGVRMGVPREYYFEGLDSDVAACAYNALGVFESLGARIEEVHIPWTQESAAALHVIALAEATSIHEKDLRVRPELYGMKTYRRLAQGFFLTAAEYLRAMRVRELLTERIRRLLDTGVDALISPVVRYPAYLIDESVQEERDDGRLTRLANLTGLPSISIPCGFTRHDLPVGLQITGRAWAEAAVLRIAHAYEQVTPWHHRRVQVTGSELEK